MQQKWWHGKVAYQIYPKSFCDSNGDGMGDIPGIISKLDYLQNLGVDLVWLSPIYPSPFVDQGYDICDYMNIDPCFGTLEDFKTLMSEAKKRGIDIVMDLVANHCSSEHEWFKKACQDPESEEAKYFYIMKLKDGKLPNNLRSYFGGSVWEPLPGHKNEDLYYSHYFAKEQPDLNWNNPKLREEIFKVVNFWIDLGVKGFRIDAILSIVKDLSFPSLEPDDKDGMCHAAKMNAKLLHRINPYLNELKARTFDRNDAFTVGEVLTVTPESVKDFAGEQGFFSTLFDLSTREVIEAEPHYATYPRLTVKQYRECVFNTQELYQKVDAFVATIQENHDQPRGISYYTPTTIDTQLSAKALGTITLLLRGIPFIYQGQEIGMSNTRFDSIEEFNDLAAKSEYQYMLDHGFSPEAALEKCNIHSRDNARTPMLWNSEANAGFTTGKPWLKVHQDYQELNAAKQEHDPESILNYYRKLVALRKNPEYLDTFTYGDFARLTSADIDEVVSESDNCVAFKRVGKKETIVVICCFEDVEPNTISASLKQASDHAKVLISANGASYDAASKQVKLGRAGVIVIAL